MISLAGSRKTIHIHIYISDMAASPKPKDHFFRPCCVTYSSPTRVESFITEVKRANIRMAATA